MRIIVPGNKEWAKETKQVCKCDDISCSMCDFATDCRTEFVDWCNSESIENPTVDWSNTNINDPIWVWDGNESGKERRHFVGLTASGKVVAYDSGHTSWTTKLTKVWNYGRPATEEEINGK